MNEEIKIIVGLEDSSIRIDKLVSTLYDNMSRSYIQGLIKSGSLLVNRKEVKPSYLTRENDEVLINVLEARPLEISAEDISLDIIYEDEHIIIVNKPKGMVVHPAAGHYTGTLVNALMHHCRDSLSDINGVLRPGIVHRIDMNTTGSLIVCKNNQAHGSIAEQLKGHSIQRKYIGIVSGQPAKAEGDIDYPIGRDKNNRLKMAVDGNGKQAFTHYRVLERLDKASLMEFTLKTGRTHQIRVHMSSIGHPLLGDSLYGEKKYSHITTEQCLHAYMLGLVHPASRKYMEFFAQIPEYMMKLHKNLGGSLSLYDLNINNNNE